MGSKDKKKESKGRPKKTADEKKAGKQKTKPTLF